MLITQCEALALKEFLSTIQGDALARKLRWTGSIANDQVDRRYSRYGSGFHIRGTDGLVTKTALVPLFQDGACLHSEKSLKDAFVAAVSETAMAVFGPMPVAPMPSDRMRTRAMSLMHRSS